MIKIYWADAEGLDLSAVPPLSEYRKNRLAALVPEQARRDSVCAELLLREALRREGFPSDGPLGIEADGNGKPFLTNGAFFFNLTHSGHHSACAIADCPVGLDLQAPATEAERLAERFFTEKEKEAVLQAKDPCAAFSRLWARKESFLKAIGLGLRRPLDDFDVSGEPPLVPCGGELFAFREWSVDGLALCLCAGRDELPLSVPILKLELP